MACEIESRAISKLTTKARKEYMEKHGADIFEVLEMEGNGNINKEVVLELKNKGGYNEEVEPRTLKLTGEYIDLIIATEIMFNGRNENTIETSNYTLKLVDVKYY